jgi:hypothetical protein
MLDFKLLPCCEFCIISFGASPASEFYVPTFWKTMDYSIFYSVGKKAYQHVCIIKVHKERGYWGKKMSFSFGYAILAIPC